MGPLDYQGNLIQRESDYRGILDHQGVRLEVLWHTLFHVDTSELVATWQILIIIKRISVQITA